MLAQEEDPQTPSILRVVSLNPVDNQIANGHHLEVVVAQQLISCLVI